jgi:N-methylhydantoinase A
VDVAELRGPGEVDFVGDALRDEAVARFHRRHEAEYGHARLGEEPEITGVRLLCFAPVPRPRFGAGFTAEPRPAEVAGVRRANLGRGFEEVQVFRGRDLVPGSWLGSPAIVEETFTTIAVVPGWEARLDDAGDYLLTHDTGVDPAPPLQGFGR